MTIVAAPHVAEVFNSCHDRMAKMTDGGDDMQGIAGFLIGFFIASWVLVLGHHFGPSLFDEGVFQASLPIAYTGAIISVGVLAVALVAVALRR